MNAPFGTIITAVITPFDAAGAINFDEFRRILRHLEASGSNGVVIAGTTGESPTLSDDEKLELMRVALDEVGGRLSVIAGTGSADTAHAEHLTRRAVELGVDGILLVTPYYNKPPRDGLIRHFTVVARAAGSTPIMLYNIPGRCVINLDPNLVAQLAEIPNIVAIKQATPELQEMRDIRTLAPDLAVYAGDDNLLLPMLPEGAVGVVSVASHIVGERMGKVVSFWNDGLHAEARELGERLNDVYETLSITTNPIPVKAAMAELGFDVGEPRLPLVPATGMQQQRIAAMIERHDLVAAHV